MLTCRRCGLELETAGPVLRTRACPRCEARGATVAPMTLSSGPLAMDRSQFRAAQGDRHCEQEPASGCASNLELKIRIGLGSGVFEVALRRYGRDPDSPGREGAEAAPAHVRPATQTRCPAARSRQAPLWLRPRAWAGGHLQDPPDDRAQQRPAARSQAAGAEGRHRRAPIKWSPPRARCMATRVAMGWRCRLNPIGPHASGIKD